MDTAHPPFHSHVFKVGVWREDLGQGQTKWRGEMHTVESRQVRHFRDWATLLMLLQEMLPKREASD